MLPARPVQVQKTILTRNRLSRWKYRKHVWPHVVGLLSDWTPVNVHGISRALGFSSFMWLMGNKDGRPFQHFGANRRIGEFFWDCCPNFADKFSSQEVLTG